MKKFEEVSSKVVLGAVLILVVLLGVALYLQPKKVESDTTSDYVQAELVVMKPDGDIYAEYELPEGMTLGDYMDDQEWAVFDKEYNPEDEWSPMLIGAFGYTAGDHQYWAFYIDEDYATHGLYDEVIEEGDSYVLQLEQW